MSSPPSHLRTHPRTLAPDSWSQSYVPRQPGAIVKVNGRYRVDYTKIGAATERLARELD